LIIPLGLATGRSFVLPGLLVDAVRATVPRAGVCEFELPFSEQPPGEVAESSQVSGPENQLGGALNGCSAL